MASSAEKTWIAAQGSWKKLQAALGEAPPSFNEVNRHLADYCSACEDVIFQDFDFAQAKVVELKLWETHGKINSRFRKHLGVFRQPEAKRRIVERRKAMKQYLDFIKSSQRFYRGFIQRLASSFGNIPELEEVARKFNLDLSRVQKISDSSEHRRSAVLESCHQTLVRLGDLSRYRETELVHQERNWGPAIGYYALASTIRPSSGASQHQLAVIAQTDGNHLRATYHLYRALTVEEPYPTAKGNLEIEFKKILTAWDKGSLIENEISKDGSGCGKALSGWFMRLHARCYKGVEFSGHDELENEVLSRLAIELKERSLESILPKMVLINISAEHFAAQRLQAEPDVPENMQAFFFFLRLNVKTYFTLLQVLQPELEANVDDETDGLSADAAVGNRSESFTAVARRVLPALRHYSSWLTTNTALLTAQISDNGLDIQIKELWKIYANTLTLLAATFPVSVLPNVEYLLEEDEDTLGFKPFENDRARRRYFVEASGMPKPKLHDRGVQRHHPNFEMLGRVRDFLADGLELAVDDEIPIALVDGSATFAYTEEGIPSEMLASPEGGHISLSSTGIDREEISGVKATATAPNAVSVLDEAESQATSVSVSANQRMNKMVDNIVGSDSTNDNENYDNDNDHHSPAFFVPRGPPTPPSYSFEDSSAKDSGDDDNNEYDVNYAVMGGGGAMQEYQQTSLQEPQQQGTPRPFLPVDAYGTPLAPMINDGLSSRPGTAKRISSSFATAQVFQPQQPPFAIMPSNFGGMQDPNGAPISSGFNEAGTNLYNLSDVVADLRFGFEEFPNFAGVGSGAYGYGNVWGSPRQNTHFGSSVHEPPDAQKDGG